MPSKKEINTKQKQQINTTPISTQWHDNAKQAKEMTHYRE
jgi:hypothetical protein